MRRTLVPELMDDPSLDPREHKLALRGLARLNRLSGASGPFWARVARLAQRSRGPLTVLDIATGSADIPVDLGLRARRAGFELDLHACDISATALDQAALRARRAGIELNTFEHDAVLKPIDGSFDLVVCSLFLHHLTDAQAVAVLRHAAQAARLALLVSDLRRDPIGLGLAWGCSRLLTRSRIVHTDAVRSVKAAFTASELAHLAHSAGLQGATLAPQWPRRMLLKWSNNG